MYLNQAIPFLGMAFLLSIFGADFQARNKLNSFEFTAEELHRDAKPEINDTAKRKIR